MVDRMLATCAVETLGKEYSFGYHIPLVTICEYFHNRSTGLC